MIVDAWMQHPTRRFLEQDMFASLRRWTGGEIPEGELPLDATVAAMDAAGVELGVLCAWHGPEGVLISNEEVAGWVAERPDRFAALASVSLRRPMEAVRELRRCVEQLGFVGLRMLPWLWETPPTDRRFYPLYAACVELGVPFCTQVGHTGPLRPSEPGRPIPYIDQIAIDFPELVIVCGHVGYPWTEEMIAVARKHENVYIDTSAYTSRRLPEQLISYVRTSGGARKVLFGSNYPMIAPAAALEDLDRLGLDEAGLELYLGENARRVFALARAHPEGRRRARRGRRRAQRLRRERPGRGDGAGRRFGVRDGDRPRAGARGHDRAQLLLAEVGDGRRRRAGEADRRGRREADALDRDPRPGGGGLRRERGDRERRR